MGEAVAHGGGLAVTARDFGLEGPRGWAFRDVTVDAPPGSLIAIEGPSGTGRTCLLLALTGRMKATRGTAAVGDLALPRRMAAVRGVSALAHVPGVTDLDPALTVAEHLHERALLQRRFTASVRALLRPRRERRAEAALRIDTALAAAGLDLAALPKGSRTAVRDLERLEALRLSVALALIGRPRLLGVDDTDLKLSDSERAEVWSLLGSLAAGGTTVLAVCSEAPEGAVAVSTGAPGGAPADTADEDTDGRTAAADTDATTGDRRGASPEDAPAGDRNAATGTDPDATPAPADPDSDDTHPARPDADDPKKEAADALAETGRS
ncbi:ATP-binding cassette domain-containing protein [Streptomyces sp. NPDC058739]|uniref:ATP-binding cassette domain-containing protein n=1 Tax=Streptomyces sp. NPDC058739 TaxID=3346618 RepID=UPI0036A66FAA